MFTRFRRPLGSALGAILLHGTVAPTVALTAELTPPADTKALPAAHTIQTFDAAGRVTERLTGNNLCGGKNTLRGTQGRELGVSRKGAAGRVDVGEALEARHHSGCNDAKGH